MFNLIFFKELFMVKSYAKILSLALLVSAGCSFAAENKEEPKLNAVNLENKGATTKACVITGLTTLGVAVPATYFATKHFVTQSVKKGFLLDAAKATESFVDQAKVGIQNAATQVQIVVKDNAPAAKTFLSGAGSYLNNNRGKVVLGLAGATAIYYRKPIMETVKTGVTFAKENPKAAVACAAVPGLLSAAYFCRAGLKAGLGKAYDKAAEKAQEYPRLATGAAAVAGLASVYGIYKAVTGSERYKTYCTTAKNARLTQLDIDIVTLGYKKDQTIPSSDSSIIPTTSVVQ
jgi:hypothetical protein